MRSIMLNYTWLFFLFQFHLQWNKRLDMNILCLSLLKLLVFVADWVGPWRPWIPVSTEFAGLFRTPQSAQSP